MKFSLNVIEDAFYSSLKNPVEITPIYEFQSF